MKIEEIRKREEKLRDYIRECSALPYREGQFDCALFVGGWVDILTGSRYVKLLKGAYDNRIQGENRFAPHGMRAAVHGFLSRGGWRASIVPVPGDVCFSRGCPGVVANLQGRFEVLMPMEGAEAGKFYHRRLLTNEQVLRWDQR
jgi:hypothetical protein